MFGLFSISSCSKSQRLPRRLERLSHESEKGSLHRIDLYKGHFAHSEKRTRFIQHKRILWIFDQFFKKKRIFAKGVREF